tara:strand:- start:3814 stop:4083 length:270 start_codon:yes stop_codon:yes gene_type:complete
MLIKINDEYAIQSDASCWAVCKWVNRASRGGSFEQITWHHTFSDAVSSLGGRMIRLSDAETLEDAIKDASQVKDTIRQALEPKFKVEEL